MITIASLVAAGCGPAQARLFADPLLRACSRFEIVTPGRMGAFVGQCLVESQGFTKLEENCYWSDPARIARFFPNEVRSIADAQPLMRNPKALAAVVYAGKNGNGQPLRDATGKVIGGDGWVYRGRGLVQLTGRGNYLDAGTELGRPYVANPDLVAGPDDACLAAAWFWSTHKCNALADAGLYDAITRQVNGPAMDKADLRKQRSQEATVAFA